MSGPIVSQLIDVYGARRINIPFSVLAIFAICMLSLCTKYWQIMLAQGVAFGIASSGVSLSTLILISSNNFPAAVRWTVLMQSILLIIANMLVSTPFEPKGW